MQSNLGRQVRMNLPSSELPLCCFATPSHILTQHALRHWRYGAISGGTGLRSRTIRAQLWPDPENAAISRDSSFQNCHCQS